MKHLFTLFVVGLLSTAAFSQNVGINTNAPDLSAALDVTSSSQGLLIPRMPKAQRDLIASPATSLVIFQTDNTPGFYYNAGTPAAKNWILMGSNVPQIPTAAASSPIYGDGSAGALVISSNTNWSTTMPTNINVQYSSITVNSGVRFTVPTGTKLRCTGNVDIQGTISVHGTERPTGSATTGWISGISRMLPGLGANPRFGIQPTSVLSLINIPLLGGGAGANGSVGIDGYGGAGGGTFAIYAQGTISISSAGEINAGGEHAYTNPIPELTENNTNGSGGGGGGVIVLLSKEGITNSGVITANGGDGSNATKGTTNRPGGGGGGGGVILLLGPHINEGSAFVNGGVAGSNLNNLQTGTSRGGAGGASGGNGGWGGITFSTTSTFSQPTAGNAGIKKQIITANPENLY